VSEYTEVERPFLDQLAQQGWTVIDQGSGIPQQAGPSLRSHFREWLLPGVFDDAVRRLNRTNDGQPWLTDAQLDELRQQLTRHSNRSLLEANESVQALLFKAQVGTNELTGESDPVVRLIDFHHPENNRFHAINQFRVDTPGCVKAFIVIERDGVVTVRPPARMTPEQIDQTVLSKRMWIYRSLAEWRELNGSRVNREWVSGETFMYLGSSYRLELVAEQDEPLKLKDGRFCLLKGIVNGAGTDGASKAFAAFYAAKGQPRLARRVAYFAPKVGVAAGRVEVKDLGYRWASCLKGGDLHFARFFTRFCRRSARSYGRPMHRGLTGGR